MRRQKCLWVIRVCTICCVPTADAPAARAGRARDRVSWVARALSGCHNPAPLSGSTSAGSAAESVCFIFSLLQVGESISVEGPNQVASGECRRGAGGRREEGRPGGGAPPRGAAARRHHGHRRRRHARVRRRGRAAQTLAPGARLAPAHAAAAAAIPSSHTLQATHAQHQRSRHAVRCHSIFSPPSVHVSIPFWRHTGEHPLPAFFSSSPALPRRHSPLAT